MGQDTLDTGRCQDGLKSFHAIALKRVQKTTHLIRKEMRMMIQWPPSNRKGRSLLPHPNLCSEILRQKKSSRSLIYMVMPDHKYNSVDKKRTHRLVGNFPEVPANVVSQATDSSGLNYPTPFPTFGSEVKTLFPTFDRRVETFPTFRPKTQKNPRRKQTIEKWLRDRITGIDIGVEIETDNGKHPVHINTNNQVLEHFERLRNGERSFMKRLSNMNFVDHTTNVATFYFSGASEPKKPETLVLIDIDCKKTGTLEGAMAFAEHLRKYHFLNLYIEVSTHGNGAHGYFVLDKLGTGTTFVNNLLLRRLQPWLRQILKEHDFDVENVEIKGTLPDLVWGQAKLEVTNYKSGTLAKLPRLGSVDKEEALRNTTRLTVDDLARLPVVEEIKKVSTKGQTASREVVGSILGKVITREELDGVSGLYGEVAAALLRTHEIRTAGRTVVTNEDVAIFLMLLKFFSQNMNSDGSLPVERWKKMWNSLFEGGDIDRAFCPQRFKAIRDFLSSLGLLDWKDRSYCLGWYDQEGEYHKGKACKWQASGKLMEMLEEPAEEEDYDVGGGRTSFIRTALLEDVQTLIQLPLEQTIRPVRIEIDHQLRLNPDDLAPLITPFEAFIGVAA